MSGGRVAVVGGGLTGLIAAHELRRLGLSVTLFEASSRPGGSIVTRKEGAWLAEAGPVVMPGLSGEVESLLESAGVGRSMRVLVQPDCRTRYLVANGVPVAVPDTTAEMIASPLLSVSGRMRLLKEPFVARGKPDLDESVLSFASRRFGLEMAQRFIDPAVSSRSGGDPCRLLAQFYLPELVELERSSGSILKGRVRAARRARREGRAPNSKPEWSCTDGMAQLVGVLVDSLGTGIRCDSSVGQVRRSGSGWLVETTDQQIEPVDLVLFALPALALSRITVDTALAHDPVRALAVMPHASMAVVSLGFDRDQVEHSLEGYGLQTSFGDNTPLRSVRFESSIFPMRVPQGMVLLTAKLGGVAHPELIDMEDGALLGMTTDLLTPLLGVKGKPEWTAINRWRNSIPLAMTGHGKFLADIDQLESSARGLTFAGAWRDGLSVRDAIRGGCAAARKCLSLS